MPTPTPKVQKVRAGLVRRLSQFDGNGKVLSVYVDLDPTVFPTAPAREVQINSLADEAERLIEELDQEVKLPLRQDVQLVREFLLGDEKWSSEARSVAIFASSENGLFDVVKVGEPLPRGVFVDERPYVLPLVEMVAQDKWCVALIDRRMARIFLGSPVLLKEYDEIEDDVHGQHQQGGWSQARYARAVEEDVEDHLRNVADRLLRLHQSQNFDHIVIGANDELWPRISNRLHSYVAEKVAAQIDVDEQRADVDELREKLMSIQAQQEQEREQSLLEDLRRRLATDTRAAAGLPAILSGLNEARSDTVLVTEGFDAPGTVCPMCGYLSESAQECPVDGARMENADSILEPAIEKADETSADWVIVRDADALAGHGSIAALLRF